VQRKSRGGNRENFGEGPDSCEDPQDGDPPTKGERGDHEGKGAEEAKRAFFRLQWRKPRGGTSGMSQSTSCPCDREKEAEKEVRLPGEEKEEDQSPFTF